MRRGEGMWGTLSHAATHARQRVRGIAERRASEIFPE
jgi:hypothetical protein